MDDRIEFRPAMDGSTWARRMSWAATVLLFTWCIVGVVRDDGLMMVQSAVWLVVLGYSSVVTRVPVVADADGLHRPLRRVVPWERIEAVVPPGGSGTLSLRCVDRGGIRTRLPARFGEQLSRITDKPLTSESAFVPVPKSEIRYTWQQEQDAFAARAARVRARNAELLGEAPSEADGSP